MREVLRLCVERCAHPTAGGRTEQVCGRVWSVVWVRREEMTMPEYQVKFQVKAIIGIEVNADSINQAIEKAKAKLARGATFAKDIDYLHGSESVCGVDDNDQWSEVP